jgi:beta-phosphoglucomutase-like phosphatase (HAD superfamily)
MNGINTQVRNGQPIAVAGRVVIEDSKEGIRGTRRAGMRCLAVTNSHPAELLADADAVIKSLEDVKLNFLQNMCP